MTDENVIKLFDENCVFNNIGIRHHVDKTSNLRLVIDLLDKANLISKDNTEDKEILLKILERYFNTFDGQVVIPYDSFLKSRHFV